MHSVNFQKIYGILVESEYTLEFWLHVFVVKWLHNFVKFLKGLEFWGRYLVSNIIFIKSFKGFVQKF